MRPPLDDGLGLPPEGIPTSAMVDADLCAALLHRSQHAVGVDQGGGQGLLTVDAGDAGLGRVDDHLGVQMVRGDHAQQIEILPRQHRPIVVVLGRRAPVFLVSGQ